MLLFQVVMGIVLGIILTCFYITFLVTRDRPPDDDDE